MWKLLKADFWITFWQLFKLIKCHKLASWCFKMSGWKINDKSYWRKRNVANSSKE
jgi:hypothetical protein